MASRLTRVKRTLKVLGNLELIERVRLTEVNRAIDVCTAEQKSLLESLGSETAFDGQFIDMIANRVGKLVRQEQQLKKVRADAEVRLTNAAVRTRVADGIAQEAAREEERRLEQDELQAIVDGVLAAIAQGRGKSSDLA